MRVRVAAAVPHTPLTPPQKQNGARGYQHTRGRVRASTRTCRKRQQHGPVLGDPVARCRLRVPRGGAAAPRRYPLCAADVLLRRGGLLGQRPRERWRIRPQLHVLVLRTVALWSHVHAQRLQQQHVRRVARRRDEAQRVAHRPGRPSALTPDSASAR